ncbi:MAG: DUF4365 domain-containing protein [Candidatus Thorarchaeota archaeon]|nr:DUF4365 domain-containing protein [Candidatus Thorarchaeota archaeon]
MAKPTPYSTTDAAEQDAVSTFESLIDSHFVKPDIRVRDKYPNVDGTIEIVDQERVPLGKLDVQVRTIGPDERKYSCPTSLVAYSEVSTLPVILICVDPSTQRAFWRQITPTMPEYKENQQGFTIHFSEHSDAIHDSDMYIHKWTDIVLDYRERIAKFPLLRSEVANTLELDSIEPQDRESLQQFIDTINNLIDNQFIAVKKVSYPNVWKLGVGVFHSDQQRLVYQIYRIPYREPWPLVCKLDDGSLLSDQYNPYAIAEHSIERKDFSNPEDVGRRFVLKHVQRFVEQKAFPIHGRMLAADVLVSFVNKYHRCLGIAPDQDSYSVTDLDYALNHHLFGVCAAIATRMTQGSGNYIHLDLDWISRYLIEKNVEPVSLNAKSVRFSIGSEWFSVRSAFESLRYLLAKEVAAIERPFAKRASLPPWGHGIWSGYSQEDEVRSATHILENCLEEYATFVQGNRLRFPNSPYLDQETSIIFEYYPVKLAANYRGYSLLKEHHIRGARSGLPKLSVFVKTEENYPVVSHRLTVKIGDFQYQAVRSTICDATFFFRQSPVLNLVYQMLSDDLSEHYDLDMIGILP